MSDRGGFFQIILLGFGVMSVFALVASLTSFGVPGPWDEVNAIIAPLVLVICFIGIGAHVVVSR